MTPAWCLVHQTGQHTNQPPTILTLSAAILANLLLGSESSDDASYGAPVETYEPVDTYGAPYEAPVETYETPVTYEEPVQDEYGSPAAAPVSYSEPLPSYGAPARF